MVQPLRTDNQINQQQKKQKTRAQKNLTAHTQTKRTNNDSADAQPGNAPRSAGHCCGQPTHTHTRTQKNRANWLPKRYKRICAAAVAAVAGPLMNRQSQMGWHGYLARFVCVCSRCSRCSRFAARCTHDRALKLVRSPARPLTRSVMSE